MSFFGRIREKRRINERRMRILESENAQLNEKCSRYQSALNEANRENENYKRKYNDLLADISSNNKCDISGSSNFELTRLEEKCNDYKHWLENANREIENYKQEIREFQKRENAMENRYRELVNQMSEVREVNSTNSQCGKNSTYNIMDDLGEVYSYDSNDVKSANLQNIKKPIYNIIDEVRKNPDYMSALYLSKNSFLSTNEYKMYVFLENLIYEYRDEFGDLSVFANTRLADVVKLFEKNYSSDKYSFCKKLQKNPNKKKICELIDKYMPDFNDDDYEYAFLYPLYRMHIDFLICYNESGTSKPILAIELHGSEHDRNSKKPDWNRIHNDEFKEALFDPKNKSMNVRLLVIKNDELNNEGKLSDTIYEVLDKCLKTKQADNTPSVLDIVKGKKWNRNIYGRKGERYIYVNDEKINITDEQEKELERYFSAK